MNKNLMISLLPLLMTTTAPAEYNKPRFQIPVDIDRSPDDVEKVKRKTKKRSKKKRGY